MNKVTSKIIYFMPLWLSVILFIFYSGFDFNFSITELGRLINKTAALTSLTLIGSSFGIGSLSFFFPKVFVPFRHFRKYLGLSGVVFVIIHVILSFIIFYRADLYYLLLDPQNPRLLAVHTGLFALIYFLIMAVTSTSSAVKTFGGKGWKILQTFGYAALASTMMHFIFTQTRNGNFLLSDFIEKAIFIFGWAVLAIRLIVFFTLIIKKHRTPTPSIPAPQPQPSTIRG